MPTASNQSVLEALIDSYQRSNTILINLLHALPESGLDARAHPDSPTVATQFSHVHSTRLFFIGQTAPEFAHDLAQLFHQEGDARIPERDLKRIEHELRASARAVCDLVQSRVESGQPVKGEHVTYAHPVLLLQHLLWHEGYHVGQIKLALKLIGFVMSEEQEESAIWGLWRTETW
jgi:uncharacterized damage-inducible protein DinB